MYLLLLLVIGGKVVGCMFVWVWYIGMVKLFVSVYYYSIVVLLLNGLMMFVECNDNDYYLSIGCMFSFIWLVLCDVYWFVLFCVLFYVICVCFWVCC